MDDRFRRGCLVRVLTDINGTAILGKFLVRRVIMYFGDISMYHTGRANARKETVVGVTEMEELDPESDSAPDYDELEATGNTAFTRYTPTTVTAIVRNKKGKEASTGIEAESITHVVDKSEVRQTTDKIIQKVNSTTVTVSDNKVALGDENATEPLVLGNELAGLMLDFLTECSKVMTPTLMGTMSPVNFPNFISLTSRIQRFLSKTSYTK